MAPLNGVLASEKELAESIGESSGANNWRGIGIICISLAAFVGLVLLTALCGCCRKKPKVDEKPADEKAPVENGKVTFLFLAICRILKMIFMFQEASTLDISKKTTKSTKPEPSSRSPSSATKKRKGSKDDESDSKKNKSKGSKKG